MTLVDIIILSTIHFFYVQVIDENDNNPVFVHPPTNLTIREDAPPGTQVALVNAVDPDADQYGLVTYLLDRKSSHGKFKVGLGCFYILFVVL